MAFNFAAQKTNVFGTYGEFSVGHGESKIRANFLLTKIRPGQQGRWENQLASQMAPWREIFNVEELSFDELIQRDLDDSRVAHDLIPYLLGETGHHARFFPPILAVLVPKQEGRSGIAPEYPVPIDKGELTVFGDLFDFERIIIEGSVSPLGVLKYNPQRTAMVIVDGQHRAMAVLALHRQLNKIWGSDPFAPYYSHIQVTPESINHIELPVCIIYFPDIHENNSNFKNAGIDLKTLCREIFTVVNKQAKEVSKSRELLLDDEDFAAFMMRRTLSSLKSRSAEIIEKARIFSFAFGDSEADSGSQVMSGQLEYCSAVAIHKMHAATGFSFPACFNLTRSSDITDGRYVRNPTRPIDLLTGTRAESWFALGRRTAKTRLPQDVSFAVEKIGDITDCIIIPLFDELRPFAVHNRAMRELLERLNDPSARADNIQNKCRTLLFEGSGSRHVFEEHVTRLEERAKDLQDQGIDIPAYLTTQIEYCNSVNRALRIHEDYLRLQRAFILFNIDPEPFKSRENSVVDSEIKIIRSRSKSIFDGVSTQAFQLGYLMAVLSIAEKMLEPSVSYDKRISVTKFVSKLFLAGMNTFFSVSSTKHRTLSGYVAETRAQSFEVREEGFRGLLTSTNIRELNEKQWEFFRYMILEIVHSKMANDAIAQVLEDVIFYEQANLYHKVLPLILNEVEILRKNYFEAAIKTALSSPEFKKDVETKEIQAKTEGKSEQEIISIVEKMISEKRNLVEQVCSNHIKAALGNLESTEKRSGRLNTLFHPINNALNTTSSQNQTQPDNLNIFQEPNEDILNNALSADSMKHQISD